MPNYRRLAVGAGAAAAGIGLGAATGAYLLHRSHRRGVAGSTEDFDTLADLGARSIGVEARDGTRLHLLEAGAGQPILLLHGVTLQSGVWRYQLAGLRDRFRVLALDHRGHGRSHPAAGGYGLDRLGADVADVLEALDLRDAVLVGHSMGGMAVMRFAERHPELLARRVRALVLVATTAEPVLGLRPAPRRDRVGRTVTTRGETLGWHRASPLRLGEGDLSYAAARLAFGDRARPEHVELTRRMVTDMDPEALARSLVGLLDNDGLAALAAVPTRSFVVVGSRDALTPPRCSRRIAAALPDAELVVLPGAGHQLMLERPNELNEILARAAAS